MRWTRSTSGSRTNSFPISGDRFTLVFVVFFNRLFLSFFHCRSSPDAMSHARIPDERERGAGEAQNAEPLGCLRGQSDGTPL